MSFIKNDLIESDNDENTHINWLIVEISESVFDSHTMSIYQTCNINKNIWSKIHFVNIGGQ